MEQICCVQLQAADSGRLVQSPREEDLAAEIHNLLQAKYRAWQIKMGAVIFLIIMTSIIIIAYYLWELSSSLPQEALSFHPWKSRLSLGSHLSWVFVDLPPNPWLPFLHNPMIGRTAFCVSCVVTATDTLPS